MNSKNSLQTLFDSQWGFLYIELQVVQLWKWRICIAIGPMLPATRPSQSDSPSWNKKEATRLLTRELAIWWDVAQSSGNRPLTDFVSWVTMCSIGPDLVQKLFSGHICTAREGHCHFFYFWTEYLDFDCWSTGNQMVNAWMTIPKRVGESLSLGGGLVKSCFQEGTVMAPAPRSILTSH